MSAMFSDKPKEERSFPTTAVAIAAVAVVILVAVLVMLGRRHGPAFDPTKPQPPAPYANSLEISNIELSESTSLSGGKSTYIDGHVVNKGSQTVTGITVQVAFPNDSGMPPQRMIEPMQLVRIRQPEVDTQPVSAAPIAPGSGADFRMIFENVNDNWNNAAPTMTAIAVTTK